MAISVVYMSRYYRTEIDAYLHLGISTMISSKPRSRGNKTRGE